MVRKLVLWVASLVLLVAAPCLAQQRAPGFYPGAAGDSLHRLPGKGELAAFVGRNSAKIARVNQTAADAKADPSKRTCFGREVLDCVGVLAALLPIASSFDADPRFAEQNAPLDEPKTDINGRPVDRLNKLHVLWTSDPSTALPIYVFTDSAGRVRQMDLTLAGDPLVATTFDDYERTKVYELAAAALPASCDLGDRTRFYRFIDNEVRPSLTTEPGVARGITTFSAYASLCGYFIGIVGGYDLPKANASRRSSDRAFSTSRLSIARL